MADITSVVIKMSKMAKEIQKLWRAKPGDFAYLPWMENPEEFEGTYSYSVLTNDYTEKYLIGEAIWIPRVDQLIDMFDEPILEILDDFNKWVKGDAKFMYSTFEQFLLAYLMLRKYNKEWNGEEWIRIVH
jgi:hypothetical protein